MDTGGFFAGVETIMSFWLESKMFIERSIAFSQDAIHVIVGVLLMLVTALLVRKPLSSCWPWLVVLVSAIMNEGIDLWVEKWPDAGMQYGEGFKDLLLTMLLPTVLVLTSRALPQLYAPLPSTDHPQRDSEQQ